MVTEDTIKQVLETDVLVIGAGNAGLFAAIAAAEKGAKTMVLEKEDHVAMIRTYIAGVGTRAQKKAGVFIDKTELVEEICRYASHRVDQRLIKRWVDQNAEAVDWLDDLVTENGLTLHSESNSGNPHSFYKAFPTQHDVQNENENVDFKPLLEDKAVSLGVEIRFETALERLLQSSEGRITGVVAKDKAENRVQINAKKGVLLCTGGYSNNPEMLKKLNPVAFNSITGIDSFSNHGDGINTASDVGAAKDDVPTVMIFDRGAMKPGKKITDEKDAPFRNFYWLGSQPFLKVNLRGERFVNESVPYDFMAHAASLEPDDLYCQIYDSNWKEDVMRFQTLGCSRVQSPSPSGGLQTRASVNGLKGAEKEQQKFIESGHLQQADTLEELAEKLHLPADTLLETISRYNELVEKGRDEDFGKESYRLSAVIKPPFYGITLGGRVLCTLDGLRVNTKMQVLDKQLEPIEGLYAAGNDSGGFFANNYPEHVPGLAVSHAFTFGRLAGQHAAMEQKKYATAES